MNFTHKTPLLPAHVGVTLIIETTADQPTFNIQTGGIVTGETATIDWGDGTTEDFTRIYNASHTYEKPGIYRIEISDVLSAISIAVADAFANYAAMVKALKINSSVFCFLASKGLQNLTNIKTLDLSNTNVTQIRPIPTSAPPPPKSSSTCEDSHPEASSSRCKRCAAFGSYRPARR